MIALDDPDVKRLVEAAARMAVQEANDVMLYPLADAAERLGICYNTLKRRIREGRIHQVNGRISGAELRRYLSGEQSRKRRS